MCLSAALEYLERGWSIFPLRPRSKEPFSQLLPLWEENGKRYPSWKPYQYETASRRDVESWFKVCPSVGLGLVTGHISGVCVLDSDSPEAFEYATSQIPAYPTVSGSENHRRHFYFQMPDFDLRNSAGKIFPRLDVRANGGFVVMPPSIHKTGVHYKWLVDPLNFIAPELPREILELLHPKEVIRDATIHLQDGLSQGTSSERYFNAALRKNLAKVENCSDGQKADELYRQVVSIANMLHAGFMTEQELHDKFYAIISHRAKDKSLASKTIWRAIEKGKRSPINF